MKKLNKMNNQPTKCWEINRDKIDEGAFFSKMTIIANTLNEAKSLLLFKYKYDIEINGIEPTYVSIPVVRYPEGDLIEYEGELKTKWQIQEIEKDKVKNIYFEKILADKEISYCYIRKGSYYYSPNCCGYTEWKCRAGVYTKEKAINEAKFCNEITIVPINIDEHNSMVEEQINILKNNIIKLK